MKKFLDKLRRGANNLAIGAKCALQTRKAEGYVDTGVKILIAVVLGALVRAFRYYPRRRYADVFFIAHAEIIRRPP